MCVFIALKNRLHTEGGGSTTAKAELGDKIAGRVGARQTGLPLSQQHNPTNLKINTFVLYPYLFLKKTPGLGKVMECVQQSKFTQSSRIMQVFFFFFWSTNVTHTHSEGGGGD